MIHTKLWGWTSLYHGPIFNVFVRKLNRIIEVSAGRPRGRPHSYLDFNTGAKFERVIGSYCGLHYFILICVRKS